MGADQLVFLTGLGVVYAVAFGVARNLLVLWPLLTPLGSFFANPDAGDITLPWASIMGFADVAGLMAASVWLAASYERRHRAAGTPRERAVGPVTQHLGPWSPVGAVSTLESSHAHEETT